MVSKTAEKSSAGSLLVMAVKVRIPMNIPTRAPLMAPQTATTTAAIFLDKISPLLIYGRGVRNSSGRACEPCLSHMDWVCRTSR